MKILVLGTGLQGKAALFDLANSPGVTEVVAADMNIDDLNHFVTGLTTNKIKTAQVDASNLDQVAKLMGPVDAAIVLLNPELTVKTAEIAVSEGCHWIDASYSRAEYQALHENALVKGVAILPEMGLDPGIDLIAAAAAIDEFDEVTVFNSYGAGVPEWEAADNPLNYKISWTFAGVLRSYLRPGRLIQNGEIVEIESGEIFKPRYLHEIYIDGVGMLEAYPNGDATKYLSLLGLDGKTANSGRFSMRWPGHGAFWDKVISLGFLEERPIEIDGSKVVPKRFVHDLLLPQLQYEDHERDLAIIMVDAQGKKDGRQKRVIYQVVDQRDLKSGFLAMQRTVGFTASIGAQMLVRGDIQKRGLLSPVNDVPAKLFFNELEKRGISVHRKVIEN